MADCIGIATGAEALSFAVVGLVKKKPVVKYFAQYPYGEAGHDVASRAAFAARVTAESPYSRLPVALCLPGNEVFLRPMSVPFVKPALIAKTLAFEIDGHLPFDVESSVLDFSISGTGEGSSKLIVAALQRDVFDKVAAPFEASGLSLRMITSDVLAAQGLSAVHGIEDYALLDVGLSSWSLAVCRKGRLVFARAAPAVPAAEKVEAALAAWYRQSLMAAPGEAEVERLLVTGDISGAIDCEAFATAAGVPVGRLEFPEAVFDPQAAPQRDLASARGAGALGAAAALALGDTGFNFYAAVRGKQNPLERVFLPAAAGLVTAALLAGALAFEYWGRYGAERARLERMASAEMAVWNQLFPGEEPPGGDVHAGLQAKAADLEKTSVESALGGKAAPFLKALAAVAQSKQAVPNVQLRRFEAGRDGKFVLEAVALNDSDAEKLASRIGGLGAFTARTRNVRSEDQKVVFQIEMTPRG